MGRLVERSLRFEDIKDAATITIYTSNEGDPANEKIKLTSHRSRGISKAVFGLFLKIRTLALKAEQSEVVEPAKPANVLG
jgi:hypothetical protein